MSIRVLVTGGAGYIGSHVIAELLAAGHQVLSVDNFWNSRPEVYFALAAISGRSVESRAVDLGDHDRLREVMAGFRPDAVIHLAALKSVDESAANPLLYYDVNVGSSVSLLRAMMECGVRRLVFSSSAAVYGESRYLPIDEAHPLAPKSPYGRTKLHVEDLLRDLSASEPALSIAILRYFNPVGCHPSGLIGEQPKGIPRNLMPLVAQVAAGSLDEVVIYGNDYDTPDGTGVRDYLHVVDLADSHVKALEWTFGNTGAREFNLGVGRGISVLEILGMFEAASGVKVPRRLSARRPGDVSAIYADPSRAEAELGWSARRGPFEMCASAWLWQQRLTGANPFLAAQADRPAP